MLAHVESRSERSFGVVPVPRWPVRWITGVNGSIQGLITVAVACFACNADKPALTDAGGGDALPCSPFADELVAFTPGTGEPSDAGEVALGAPDGDVIVIDTDASLTVAFLGIGAIIDEEGIDIVLHATASEDGAAVAYVSGDGESYRFAGDVAADSFEIDLATASASTAAYFRIVGTAGTVSVDAIEAVMVDCNQQ